MKTIVVLAIASALPSAAVDNFPQLKEGLWKISTQTISNPGSAKIEGNSAICRNHAYDDRVRMHAKTAMKGCQITSEKFENGKFTQVSHCDLGGRAIDSTAVTTADGDTATHTESHTTYKPTMAGRDETVMIMDEKYAGSCPAGMEAGDRMDKDGKIMHAARPTN